MPIKSYIAHTTPFNGPSMAAAVGAIPGCDAIAAGNRDALIIVTDSPSEEDETVLRGRLESLEGLHGLTLVSAFADKEEAVAL